MGHIQFDYLASMPTFYKHASPDWTGNRGWMFGWTYVAFNRAEDITKAKAKMEAFYMNYYKDMWTAEERKVEAQKWRFQPLTDIHLQSNLIQEMGPNSSIIYIYIFIGVEVLILLIACVNFINLFTTHALKRIKEVGIRKILGADKGTTGIAIHAEKHLSLPAWAPVIRHLPLPAGHSPSTTILPAKTYLPGN